MNHRIPTITLALALASQLIGGCATTQSNGSTARQTPQGFPCDNPSTCTLQCPDGGTQHLGKHSRGVYLECAKGNASHGPVLEWDTAGNPVSISNYHHGKRHGVFLQWNADGTRNDERHYHHGKPHGPFLGWHKNGQLSQKDHYRHGERHGEEIGWYSNGQKSRKGRYEAGHAVGTWKFWERNGDEIIKTGTMIVAPEKDSPEWVLQQALRAAHLDDWSASWAAFRPFLHSKEQTRTRMREWRTLRFDAIRRKLHSFVQNAETFSYHLHRNEQMRTDEVQLHVHARDFFMSARCAFQRDPKADNQWRIRWRCLN